MPTPFWLVQTRMWLPAAPRPEHTVLNGGGPPPELTQMLASGVQEALNWLVLPKAQAPKPPQLLDATRAVEAPPVPDATTCPPSGCPEVLL